ncbi:MAG TPA: hypothetical protein VGH38_06630, partial [Bryobacteraceae bacterium]
IITSRLWMPDSPQPQNLRPQTRVRRLLEVRKQAPGPPPKLPPQMALDPETVQAQKQAQTR